MDDDVASIKTDLITRDIIRDNIKNLKAAIKEQERRYARGYTIKALAYKYDCSLSIIKDIEREKTWAHIEV